ncbi:type VI secretion system baseplate subunit TssG [Aureimonas jatrophae]|uniref:Type VI secretion system protein ImpH n=1 Tax=Aureimonas jatrophae TaxID=1166073 RepID=A0A1H0N441_9HYPH|nr:type VI secretion system baseplate subunit TssG [Aureimonas jatrophae]MBB3953021.1 type VI secretion system protein ImpH [Aureimonas jatrophae]SDO87275.1 type VI secretion system protein ImpH [Aureimonas jatrophae]
MSALAKPADDGAVDPLVSALLADPQSFEPTTAIRIAERAGASLEIGSEVSTRLAPAAIASVTRRSDRVMLRSTLPGLVGALGALPPSYTETVLEEERHRSRAFRAFLDVFADPIARLMVDANEKYRLPRLLRWRKLSGGNRIVGALLAFAGVRTPETRRLNPLGDEAVLRYAGLFATRSRNASGLGSMLAAHLRLPVEIEQFSPRWVPIPVTEQTALGASRGARLGVDAAAGQAIRDYAGAFRVVVGPVGYADYLSFEPGKPRMEELMQLVRLYVGPSLRFDVQVVLRREDVPFCRLGEGAIPARLGWNSWARVAPSAVDSRDAIVAATA